MMKEKMCVVHWIAWVLVIIGALNWGLVGIASNWNVVHIVFGSWAGLERVIYLLVGVSAIVMLLKGSCKMCKVSEKA